MEKEEQDKQKGQQGNLKMLALITQFGINMLVPIFLCFFAGMFLDRKLGTNYITIIAFFVGAVAGFRNVYIFAKKSTRTSSKEDSFEEIRRQIREESGQADADRRHDGDS